MARLDWKVPLAALSLLAVLAGGTVLSAQVQRDLDSHIDLPPTAVPDSADSTPLKLNDLKLPSKLPVTLPKGANVSADLSKLTLPKDLNVTIPPGMNLSGTDFTLPKDFKLDLPPGAQFDGKGLTLPDGANFTLPDGAKFTLPPGSKLDVPPELAKKLADQGLPTGTLPKGASFDVRDLPPNLQAQLLGPALAAGGSLRLPGGTTIQLPAGSTFSNLAGPLAAALPYVLPPGTTIDMPYGQGLGSGAFPVPTPTPVTASSCSFSGDYQRCSFACNAGDEIVAAASSNLAGDFPRTHATCGSVDAYCQAAQSCYSDLGATTRAGVGACVSETVRNFGSCKAIPASGSGGDVGGGAPVSTDINPIASPVRKGQPTTITGYVNDRATGRGVAGAPVDIYLNQTKQQVGDLLGATTTDANGRFSFTFTFPAGKQAGSWQLVNHALAFATAQGARYADGWGDPPITATASTTLTILMSDPVAHGASVPIKGTLKDSDGAPISGARIRVSHDGLETIVTTQPTGDWETSAYFDLGQHTVTASFGGTSTLDPSAASRTVTSTDSFTIQTDSFRSVQRGTYAELRGTVVGGGAFVAGDPVRVTFPWGEQASTTTQADGTFLLRGLVPKTQPLGRSAVDVTDDLRSTSTQVLLEIWAPGALQLSAADGADRVAFRDSGFSATAIVTDEQGNLVASQLVTLTLVGPGGQATSNVITGGDGKALFSSLTPPSRIDGRYTLTARLPASSYLRAPAATAALTLGNLRAAWDIPATAIRGHSVAVAAVVTFAGEPLRGEPATLTLLGAQESSTDSNGRAAWTVEIPAQTPLGPTQAQLRLKFYPSDALVAQTTIQAIPKLNVTSPDADFDPASGVEVDVKLTDDLNVPLSNRPVQLHVKIANWTDDRTVTTDARGAWKGHVDTKGAPRANLTVQATHSAADVAVPAHDLHTVALRAAPVVAPVGSALPIWALLALVGVVVAGGGGAAVYVLRRKPAAIAEAPIAAPAPLPPPVPAADFEIVLGIPPGEPQVWGVGEPLEIQVRPRGEPRPGGHVLLEAEGARAEVTLDAQGEGHAAIVPDREGEQLVRATRPDGSGGAAEARLRVVEYRKAVAEEFDALLERARRVEPLIDRQTTPREMHFLLAAKLGTHAEDALDRMAAIMERTNYSTAAVTRRDYLDFCAARKALEGYLSGA